MILEVPINLNVPCRIVKNYDTAQGQIKINDL